MKLPLPFMQLPLMFDAAALAAEANSFPESCWRGRTQQNDGNSALVLIAAGGDPDSDDLSGPMQPTPHLQRMPYVQQVLAAIGATWGRARLMRLSGQAEVRAHVDMNYYWRDRARVHVPIVTSPGVRFQCGDAEVNMAAGECWIFDTWRRHRVLNSGNEERIHLVADTVGGARFWDLLAAGRGHLGSPPGWRAAAVPASPQAPAALDFELVNAPIVMTPWELKEICVFLLGEAVPDSRLDPIQRALLQLARHWQALWACHGEDRAGWPRYRALLDETRQTLRARGVAELGLRNETGLADALDAYIFDKALADGGGNRSAQLDQHGMEAASSAPAMAPARRPGGHFERPLFIVSPPRSGSTLLFETLAGAPELYTIGDESHQLIEGVEGLDPDSRRYASNQLIASDADPRIASELRQRFWDALRDRQQRPPLAQSSVRMLEKTPKNTLRVPFLDRVFDDARFIFLYRDPRQVLASMIEGWQSGRFNTYPKLPGWNGPPWSFLLVPGWQSLAGRELAEIVASQWEISLRELLDSLDALPRERWIAVDYGRLVEHPQVELERVCAWAGLAWDRRLGGQLPLSRYTLSPPASDKWQRHAALIEPQLAAREALLRRAQAMAAY